MFFPHGDGCSEPPVAVPHRVDGAQEHIVNMWNYHFRVLHELTDLGVCALGHGHGFARKKSPISIVSEVCCEEHACTQ